MKLISLPIKILAFGSLILLMLIGYLIVQLPLFPAKPNLLSFGITFDFLVTIPFLYYLIIRKTTISNQTVSVLVTINLILLSLILPEQNQLYLHYFTNWIAPVFEVIILFFILKKVKRSLQKVKNTNSGISDFFSILKAVSQDVLPKRLAIFLTTEIAAFYYGFINWKSKKLTENEFSYHKKRTIISTLIAFIFVAIIEMSTIHHILIKKNAFIAWLLFVLSIYTILQLFGFMRAMPKRPIVITDKGILLRYSILAEAFISFNNIKNIAINSKEISNNDLFQYFSPFRKMEGNNVLIELHNSILVTGFYGKKKQATNLALFVDDKEDFVLKVQKQIKDYL